jgi:16S rRNA (cytosine967-C5)-methyltransferase
VKPGGRLVYVTCSVLPQEDEDRVAAFLARTPGFVSVPATADEKLTRYLTPDGFLRLTPHSAGTDGFFVAVLEKPR